ncbi:hypothetical protein QF030_000284 [Streptomyces rishiriensis]|uniref:Integrase n=1 Tax=Streptomyces rishiriensis TaxID=68264 RepID=A0ABU0NG65_STRRH|nr:hypothetical protein [Streptomyces rishiriensis]
MAMNSRRVHGHQRYGSADVVAADVHLNSEVGHPGPQTTGASSSARKARSSTTACGRARILALPPAIASSPPASRPYDPRHSALSTWLNAGVDCTQVAERAGNSVEVLLTRYAKCLDGRQNVANRRIEDLLREYE